MTHHKQTIDFVVLLHPSHSGRQAVVEASNSHQKVTMTLARPFWPCSVIAVCHRKAQYLCQFSLNCVGFSVRHVPNPPPSGMNKARMFSLCREMLCSSYGPANKRQQNLRAADAISGSHPVLWQEGPTCHTMLMSLRALYRRMAWASAEAGMLQFW